jgi:hypothetical protein
MQKFEIPEISSKWKHKNGTTYEVVLVANILATKADYPIIVNYKNDAGEVWARTLEKWQEMTKI